MTDDHPIAKVGLSWFGVFLAKLGIQTWSDVAAVVATIYTVILIADWCLKRWKRRSERN